MIEWRPIKGYESTYEVSNDGRVRRTAQILDPFPAGPVGKRYSAVYLYRNKMRSLGRIHRLVGEAFLPPPGPGQTEINHKDAIKTNNVVENLEWSTRLENHRHAIGMGLVQFAPNAKLSHALAEEIRGLFRKNEWGHGSNRAALAAAYDVSPDTIGKIVNNHTWVAR